MKMAKITLAGLVALIALSSASLAQQAMTGTVTRIDRLDGTGISQQDIRRARSCPQRGQGSCVRARPPLVDGSPECTIML